MLDFSDWCPRDVTEVTNQLAMMAVRGSWQLNLRTAHDRFVFFFQTLSRFQRLSPVVGFSLFLVATVRGKIGENRNFSRSGKNLGTLHEVREILNSKFYLKVSEKSGNFTFGQPPGLGMGKARKWK